MEAPFHSGVDTGMSRIGFQATEADADICEKLAQLPGIIPEGLFSHFATADCADLTRAKDMGANVIVCYISWWPNANYYTDVRDDEKAVVDYLCQNGADIIIGGGVKVPQPIELRKIPTENGYKNCVVAYSLGSLVSCLNDSYTNLSAVLDVQLKRVVDNGEIWISHVSYRPRFMLDTDDYSDVSEAPYKYRLYDLYSTLARYDAVNEGGG